MYNTKTHGDFSAYYDSNLKRNYWVLGYFGGGSVNVCDAYELAKQFCLENNVPLNTIKIDEVLYSSRYKGFKYMYSDVQNQKQADGAFGMSNVFEFLTR